MMIENLGYDFKWSRPTTLPFPHIWHQFQVKSSTGDIINIRIEDLTQERHDEVWQFFVQHYFHDEPIANFSYGRLQALANSPMAVRLYEDEASLASLENDYRTIMKQDASLIAVLDEPGPNPTLIGAHLKAVISKDEPIEPPPEKIVSAADKYNYICLNFRVGIDACREFDCETFFDDFGLCVGPRFRGLKVAEHLLATSCKYAIEFNIRGELVTLVNPSLRPVANKFGFRVFREVPIEDLKDDKGNPLIVGNGLKSIFLGGCQFY